MDSIQIRDCLSCETALCDYVDGTLAAELRPEMEAHLAQCPSCTAYLSDIREGMSLLSEVEPLEAPPILVNKILLEIPVKATGWRAWLGRFLEPILQPRLVMGAMMTVLSLAMMTRCAGVPSRSLTSSDLDPVKIWAAFDDRLHRTWDRSVKGYESMRLVYEVRSRIHEWRAQQEEQDSAAAEAAANQALKNRRLPAQTNHQVSDGKQQPLRAEGNK